MTPDILPEFLQYGGRPAFTMRLILAATLCASYGIYGPPFERLWHIAREPGSEEYLHSEKYEIRHWPPVDDDLSELIALVNRIRRENPALQQNVTLKFHTTSNEHMLCFSKSAGENVVVTVVNLDPRTRPLRLARPRSPGLTTRRPALLSGPRPPEQRPPLLAPAPAISCN